MPEDEVAPAGSGVGELGTSVRLPPLTAKTETKCGPEPLTSRYLPSGDRRASMFAPPPLMAKLEMRPGPRARWGGSQQARFPVGVSRSPPASASLATVPHSRSRGNALE